MENNNLGLGYAKDKKIMGYITEIDFAKGVVTLTTSEDSEEVKFGDFIQLKEVGKIGESIIYDGDVLSTDVGTTKMYELELNANGEDVQLHLLNKKLERIESGEVTSKDILNAFGGVMTLIGNIHEMKDELQATNFNVEIVKDFEDGVYTYFYACNNKELEKVDLIKVVFIGSQLLEEDYSRTTLSYEVYIDSLDAGTLNKVSSQELMNYATGVSHGVGRTNVNPANEKDLGERQEYYCKECNELVLEACSDCDTTEE